MKKNCFNLRRVGVVFCQFFESFADLVFIGVLIFKLNAKHGLSFGSLTNADKCRSVHLWVGVEDTLTRYGKESLGMEFDPVAFAPTEPKSALGIKIPQISHSVANRPGVVNF